MPGRRVHRRWPGYWNRRLDAIPWLDDGACGTGGMLTVAEDVLQQLAEERGKRVSKHLFGQEINAETYAICKVDLLLKGEGKAGDNILGPKDDGAFCANNGSAATPTRLAFDRNSADWPDEDAVARRVIDPACSTGGGPAQ